MEMKKRRYFPDEFKREAVERAKTSGLSVMSVAAELGIARDAVAPLDAAVWRIGDGLCGGAPSRRRGPVPGRPGGGERPACRRELQKAQMERDILKKAALIFGAASR